VKGHAEAGGAPETHNTTDEYLLYIGGQWRAGHTTPDAAISPATGERFASVAVAGPADVDDAVQAAARAWPDWAARSPFERAAWCERVAGAILGRRDDLARVLTLDQGKPLLAEAYDEVDELAEYFRMAAADVRRLDGAFPPSTSAGRRVITARVPLGVVAVISPWNWPYTMGAELFAPALAAGNAVVWVPAPSTSACCAVLAGIIAAEGTPPGVFSFLPGPGPVAGDALAGHPAVAAVGFIGSVATGGLVAARAAGKTQLLELGGNGPMVILEDADLDLAVDATLEAAYLCAGQSCTAGERFLVHAAVRAEFTERLVAATADRVRLGDPFDPETTMGPLNNEATAAKFDRHVADAVSRGAKLCHGGRRAPGFPTSLYAEPTVLDGVTADMLIATEETFGPVVPITPVTSAAQALELTNSSPFGLTAAVFTSDLERGLAFAEQARAGWVNVNASTNLWESHLPFGGRSGSVSGRGRVGGRFAMETFTEPKTILYPGPRLSG
jgi:acyl-CoA reductase-like NAD-dependent aldehyde dehydrogenase